MKICVVVVGLFLFSIAAENSQADLLLQSDSRARFGEKSFSYFFIEAEDFHTNDPHGDGESWLFSSDEDALLFTINEEINPETDEPFELDPGAFASGGESITNTIESLENGEAGGGNDVQYQIQFDTPGTYHLYIRQHSPLGPETNRNRNDSFFYPVEFGEDPIQLKANGDDYGMLESIEFPGDTFRRGPWVWFAARDGIFNDEQDPPIDQDSATFLEYDVTANMVGNPLILEFDHRENGTMLDAFLFVETSSGLPPTNGEGPDGNGFTGIGDEVDMEFGLSNLGSEITPGVAGDFNGDLLLTVADIDLLSTEVRAATNNVTFDLNGDNLVDNADRTMWVQGLKNTYFGDSNLDGEFNSSDFVLVFQGGKFELAEDATWAEGDWDGDGRFGSGDFVVAFQGGGFEIGPKAGTQSVPEPTGTFAIFMIAAVVATRGRRLRLEA